MRGPLEGVGVLDLTLGVAGPMTTMLMSDYGAQVTRVERPGSHPLSRLPAYAVWNRGKDSVRLDLKEPADRQRCIDLASASDVVVAAYRPGVAEALGVDYQTLRESKPDLVYCTISAYPRGSRHGRRAGYDGLVQARTGMQWEQPGWRPGPVFLHAPLPSLGAFFLASCAINAALLARDATGVGQHVETSLFDGVLAWTALYRSRVADPPPGFDHSYRCPGVSNTPCFQTGDGRWLHPTPGAADQLFQILGLDANPVRGSATGTCDEIRDYQSSQQELYLQLASDQWLKALNERDLRCAPVLSVEEAFYDEQILHNRLVADVEVEGVGVTKQFAGFYRMEKPEASRPSVTSGERWPAPLHGIRVLDFGIAVAGPFGPMIMSDLGADVIRVDNTTLARSAETQVWAGSQRGKRSITLDLKTADGREIVDRLLVQADVVHHNMRPGVAERLGIGYERVRAMNPGVVYCHLTGYGPTGPLASRASADAMAQAMCGLDHEQGAAPDGGKPTWLRFGMVDQGAGLLTVVAVLQALRQRLTTGEGQLVETDLLSVGALFSSDAFMAPGSEEATRAHLDRDQTGLGPLYRLYRTADGWICIACVSEFHWLALTAALDLDRLTRDPCFHDGASRASNAGPLAEVLGAAFERLSTTECVDRCERHGVPSEVPDREFTHKWLDEDEGLEGGWLARYDHPIWGLTEQLGALIRFSETPAHPSGPPVIPGQHGQAILSELGYRADEIARFVSGGVTTFANLPARSVDA
ncbi:MAG: CoA transferase [Acidimicrobiales bacterium]|nr:CoA transferase [Acidimicrobiales bacterium]